MRGLDIGTATIIEAREISPGQVSFTEFKDAFFRIKPPTSIAAKMIEKGLVNQKYFKDSDGSFVVVGQDAVERAIERRMSASRPMYRGVISPKEQDARRILKFIFQQLLGPPIESNEKLVYCVPAQPVDQDTEEFNTGYHEDAMGNDLKDLGYDASSINEAEAVCYSELEDSDYTGLVGDWGAGMSNWCLMSSGDAVLRWSSARSGDWLDRMTAASTGEADSVVQVEKEHGDFTVGQENSNRILSALAAYYVRLIDYSFKWTEHRLNTAKDLPKISKPIPLVIAGGTSQAKGFLEQVQKSLNNINLPFKISEVRYAKDRLRCISRGCLISASLR